MHYVYIIYSKSIDHYYVGESEDYIVRLMQHNTGFFKTSSTKNGGAWVLKLLILLGNRVEARRVENYIKSMKSRKFIEGLITEFEFRERFKSLVKEKFDITISFS